MGQGDVCLERSCAVCCYDTEMVLTNDDIARLQALGHNPEDFVDVDEAGYASLKNVEATAPRSGKHCFFLKEDKCSVYAHRPEGCRWYPVILSEQGKVVRDEDCPHRQAFPIPPAAERKLLKIISVLTREAQKR